MAKLFYPASVFRWNDLVYVNFQTKWLKPSFCFFVTRILHVKNDLLFDGWMTYSITSDLLNNKVSPIFQLFFVDGMDIPTNIPEASPNPMAPTTQQALAL
jgi:hypothetical protein